MLPARSAYERPSRQRSPATASMITTGSVRGKCCALQAGQSRRQPPCDTLVGAPQLEQKRCRACQCSSALAFGDRRQVVGVDQPLDRDRAQIGDDEVVARLQRLDALGIERRSPKRPAPSSRPRKTVSSGRRQRARLGQREQRVEPARGLLQRRPSRRRSRRRRRAGRAPARRDRPHRRAARPRARSGFAI